MNRLLLFSIVVLAFPVCSVAQKLSPTNNLSSTNKTVYAFTNANIFTANGMERKATLIIENDKIIAVGKNIGIPKNAQIRDVKGHYIYPSFIDLYSTYGMPALQKKEGKNFPQYDAVTNALLTNNDAVKPYTNALISLHLIKRKASCF